MFTSHLDELRWPKETERCGDRYINSRFTSFDRSIEKKNGRVKKTKEENAVDQHKHTMIMMERRLKNRHKLFSFSAVRWSSYLIISY